MIILGIFQAAMSQNIKCIGIRYCIRFHHFKGISLWSCYITVFHVFQKKNKTMKFFFFGVNVCEPKTQVLHKCLQWPVGSPYDYFNQYADLNFHFMKNSTKLQILLILILIQILVGIFASVKSLMLSEH